MSSRQVDSKKIKLVVDAFGTSDYGDDGLDAPVYAALDVSKEMLRKLLNLIDVCHQHGLTEVRLAQAPQWGPGDVVGDLYLQDCELVVKPGGSFHFIDYPMCRNYRVESREIDFNAVQVAFQSASNNEVVFLSDDPGLRRQYFADNGPEGSEGDELDRHRHIKKGSAEPNPTFPPEVAARKFVMEKMTKAQAVEWLADNGFEYDPHANDFMRIIKIFNEKDIDFPLFCDRFEIEVSYGPGPEDAEGYELDRQRSERG